MNRRHNGAVGTAKILFSAVLIVNGNPKPLIRYLFRTYAAFAYGGGERQPPRYFFPL